MLSEQSVEEASETCRFEGGGRDMRTSIGRMSTNEYLYYKIQHILRDNYLPVIIYFNKLRINYTFYMLIIS